MVLVAGAGSQIEISPHLNNALTHSVPSFHHHPDEPTVTVYPKKAAEFP
jgi:hypothetical protein